MELDSFIAHLKVKPKQKGKLLAWKEDILKLRSVGATYRDIQEYLRLNNVAVSINSLVIFCKKNNDTKTEKTAITQNVLPTNKPKTTTADEKEKIKKPSEDDDEEEKRRQKNKELFANYKPPSWAGDVKLEDLI